MFDKIDRIKIFKIETIRGLDGHTLTTKSYIHPVNSFLYALVRDLSAKEKLDNKSLSSDVSLKATINKRHISSDMYVEFKKRTDTESRIYSIVGIDEFNNFSNDITLFLELAKQQIKFDKVVGTQW